MLPSDTDNILQTGSYRGIPTKKLHYKFRCLHSFSLWVNPCYTVVGLTWCMAGNTRSPPSAEGYYLTMHHVKIPAPAGWQLRSSSRRENTQHLSSISYCCQDDFNNRVSVFVRINHGVDILKENRHAAESKANQRCVGRLALFQRPPPQPTTSSCGFECSQLFCTGEGK